MNPTHVCYAIALGIEVAVLRQQFVALQEKEGETIGNLISDSLKWNKYLEIYTEDYKKLYPSKYVQ